MKKTIAILLVLVIGMVGVWAASIYDDLENDTEEKLILTTTVNPRYGLKIANEGIFGGSLGQKIAAFIGLEPITTVLFSESDLTETLYMNYLNNQKGYVTISTSMTPMVSSTGSDSIGYKVTINGNDTEVSKSETGKSITFISEGSAAVTGMRVASKEFIITMDSHEWMAASAGTDYETTWTVTLTNNT